MICLFHRLNDVSLEDVVAPKLHTQPDSVPGTDDIEASKLFGDIPRRFFSTNNEQTNL